MIAFEEMLMSVTEWSDTTKDRDDDTISRPKKGKQLSFIDICNDQTL